MIKIRFYLICLIFAFNASSQTKQPISIDSLGIIYNKNYRLSPKLSPNEFTDIAHDFLKLLDTQKKIYKSFNNRKISQKTKSDINQLIPFRVLTYLDLMLYGTIKNNIDSVQLYKTKILSLTKDPGLVGESLGVSAYTYLNDNTEMVSYLKEIFSDFVNCTFAFNGNEALAKVNDTNFDLIISDVRMPEMNGFQFKKELNETSHYREIPFIVMSSVSETKSNKFKTDLGINDYLEKPFTKNEIISRVQLSLERTLNRKKIVGEKITTDFDSNSNRLVEQIRECIISNITNPGLNVNMLAEACGYSQKRLNEILKIKLGLSLVNVILEVKLLKAYEFIVKNKFTTIKEVMFAVGINSRPYFYKKFNERFGIKIGELKNKYSHLS